MELLFSSGLSIAKAEIIPLDIDHSTVIDARFSSTTTSGKTRVVIPIKEKNAFLKIRTSSGVEFIYRVYNDGIKDDEIEGYYQEMRSIAVANKKVILEAKEDISSNQKMITSLPAVFTLNTRFRSEIMAYQLTDFDGFDHPMIRTAVGFYGTTEIPGAANNAKIVEFFHATGHRNINDDETHWCSAFMMYCAKMNGLAYPKNALARSWMKVGKKVDQPQVGDLVVFGWKESYHGHVIIYLGEVNGMVIGIGGNQDDEVNVSSFSKECILGYRRLN
jgi:uncharacterized protein (TIGR02594 family)